jgi:hypothetical protein
VHELDRNTDDDGRLRARRRRQVHEQRTQPLPARGERLRSDVGDDAPVRADGLLQPLLEVCEVGVQPGRFPNLRERSHLACAV